MFAPGPVVSIPQGRGIPRREVGREQPFFVRGFAGGLTPAQASAAIESALNSSDAGVILGMLDALVSVPIVGHLGAARDCSCCYSGSWPQSFSHEPGGCKLHGGVGCGTKAGPGPATRGPARKCEASEADSMQIIPDAACRHSRLLPQ